MKEILLLAKHAQMQLQATQRNWDEQCLFNCNDILEEIITRLTKHALDFATAKRCEIKIYKNGLRGYRGMHHTAKPVM